MPVILNYGLTQQIKSVTQSTKAEESRRNVNHTWHSEVIIYKAGNDCRTSTEQLLSTHMLSQEIVSLTGLWTLQTLFHHDKLEGSGLTKPDTCIW